MVLDIVLQVCGMSDRWSDDVDVPEADDPKVTLVFGPSDPRSRGWGPQRRRCHRSTDSSDPSVLQHRAEATLVLGMRTSTSTKPSEPEITTSSKDRARQCCADNVVFGTRRACPQSAHSAAVRLWWLDSTLAALETSPTELVLMVQFNPAQIL